MQFLVLLLHFATLRIDLVPIPFTDSYIPDGCIPQRQCIMVVFTFVYRDSTVIANSVDESRQITLSANRTGYQ